MSLHLRSMAALLALIAGMILLGAVVLARVEGLGMRDALYFVVVTVTTVGYGDIVPKTGLGKLVSTVIILVGVFCFLAATAVASSYLVEQGISRSLGITRMRWMRGHVVIYRYNELAEQVIQELRSYGVPFVVVDEREDAIKRMRELGLPFIAGDAGEREILLKANIQRAKGVILTSRSNAENTFVAMAVKELNPELVVASRCENHVSHEVMRSAGIDYMLDPREVALSFLIRSVLAPYSEEFLDRMALMRGINVAQMRVGSGSPLAGRSIAESRVRSRTGASIVGVLRGQELILNPKPELVIEAGDVLLMLGRKEQLAEAERLVRGRG